MWRLGWLVFGAAATAAALTVAGAAAAKRHAEAELGIRKLEQWANGERFGTL